MTARTKALGHALLAVGVAAAIGACGGASSSSTSANAPVDVTLLMGGAPQSLDPQMDDSTQGAEVTWISYTGLITYAHASGSAGTRVIPGLCTALPVVSDSGRRYTCTLRKGLVFSNGSPVVAADFSYTVERAIRLSWAGAGFFIAPVIAGARAFSDGKARRISGITTDNRTGRITIQLTAPYGPFDNVLAFPALGLVYPPAAPFKNEPANPPPGVGPYYLTNIVPGASFTAVPNPRWASFHIPGIPSGTETVNVKCDQANVAANAEAVLHDRADFFDWTDVIPRRVLRQIHARALNRFRLLDLGGSTDFAFLNSQERPFDSQLAREAVVTGLDARALRQIDPDALIPACHLLPPAVIGHTAARCPYGDAGFTGNIAEAQALVQESGMAGTPVTVWSMARGPSEQWMAAYTDLLDRIGFKATLRAIPDDSYWTTVGSLKLHPQTGFDSWHMGYPDPADFYQLVTQAGILPADNLNLGEVQDPAIDSAVARLQATAPARLGAVRARWQAIEQALANGAYVAVFGYQTSPFFTSDRINYRSLVFQPEYGWDYTSFRLK